MSQSLTCGNCFGECPNGSICPQCQFDNATTADGPQLPAGTVLEEKYQLGRVLGHGGFGITYLAYDNRLQRRVAIKEYFPSDLSIRNADTRNVAPRSGPAQQDFAFGLKKFIDEAQTLAGLRHPHIVMVHDSFEAHGTAYYVMDFIDGLDLRQQVTNHGPMGLHGIDVVVNSIGQALSHAHERSITHRDVSPSNIMWQDSGHVVLIDFGAARVATGIRSRSIETLCSEGFSPLEQYSSSGKVGPWTDVYSLAATLFFCLTGHVPQSAPDRSEEDGLVEIAPLRPDLPEKLISLIHNALALKINARTQTVSEFITSWTAGRYTYPPPPPATPQLPAPAGRSEPRLNIVAKLFEAGAVDTTFADVPLSRQLGFVARVMAFSHIIAPLSLWLSVDSKNWGQALTAIVIPCNLYVLFFLFTGHLFMRRDGAAIPMKVGPRSFLTMWLTTGLILSVVLLVTLK